jgi:TorA maturation chaperone TorD
MDKTQKNSMAPLAMHRSNIYGFLAIVYRQEVTSDLLQQIKDPQFLGVLSNFGVNLNNNFIQHPEEDLLEDLAVEYARLFLGPGKHISPHESVHHQIEDGQNGKLWGASTVETKKFIESLGLSCKPEYTGLPDHISVELELMQQITQREKQAWAEGDKKTALKCLKKEKKFIKEHLARWIPDFCNKVIQEAELPLYREMAKLTKNFIQFETKEIDKLGENFS